MSAERQFYAITPTQFTDQGKLDAETTAANMERATEFGVTRFLLTGAYGEFQSLDDAERVDLIDKARNRLPKASIMAGAVHPSTGATLRLANLLFQAGANEVMVGPPAMSETSNHDLLEHFDYLQAHADGCLVLYNNPIFGHDVDPQLITRIAEMPAFSAIKQGTPSILQFIDSVAAAHGSSGRLKVYAASDIAAVATLAVGADGLTSTNFWAFPEAFVTLTRAVGTSEHTLALEINSALKPYFEQVRTLGQPRAVKAVMELRGFGGTPMVRLPYRPLSEVERHALEEVVKGVDSHLEGIEEELGIRAS